MKWINFEITKKAKNKLPKEKKYVLLQVKEKGTLPPSVVIGYLKFAAGDKNSPYFAIPGAAGEVEAWCDCLPKDFYAPLWPGTFKSKKK